jgi:hypothetical protein
MKSLPILFGCVLGLCFGRRAVSTRHFSGVWNLDLSKSNFAPGTAPKGGQVIFNQNGYVVTFQDPPAGLPHMYSVAIVHGECYTRNSRPTRRSECALASAFPKTGRRGQ